ncbi:Glycine cleavage system P protein [Metarhizium album ARSEF 1941]|uniref:Glycine cleavage system P protein n=1 Tax=Metarhizium album (strain ARSEF 1941) TaxID=1081103 RepID=A0A0B2X4U5_METAS|nr:Glycine cleavage system P protein [Metarhizium album ARSEF 1941]KHO01389.1 Glycine cleavage system P protein [Metarhizium album ARSEF 1941]
MASRLALRGAPLRSSTALVSRAAPPTAAAATKSCSLVAAARSTPVAARAVVSRCFSQTAGAAAPKARPGSIRKDPAYLDMQKTSDGNPEPWMDFSARHIGPRDEDIPAMLKQLGSGLESLEAFVAQVIPEDIMLPPQKTIQPKTYSESGVAELFKAMNAHNEIHTWMNGGGYYPVEIPAVIKRNILENPAWYTSYTPYQAEISQGRLQSLLNFQTMVSDLTGLPVANASLLDEGTAAAEAMTMSLGNLSTSRAKRPGKTYVVSHLVHNATFEVMRGRAEGFGIRLEMMDLSATDAIQRIRALGDDLVGVLAQYPDTNGGVGDFRHLADVAHEQGTLFSVATDLSALTLLTPPGEWGADVAFGNSQRFGVPLGFGGPHAAFMAVKEASKRRLPGRIIGVSKDRTGGRALRLALQTREQHIRREKATSNVCTAQALLANMAAMYAIYHGPAQLREMAVNNLRYARMLQSAAQHYGLTVPTLTLDPQGRALSDTIAISFENPKACQVFRKELLERGISGGKAWTSNEAVLAVPTTFTLDTYVRIVEAFQAVAKKNHTDRNLEVANKFWSEGWSPSLDEVVNGIPQIVRRESSYLTHPVFNSHHSETEMLRYIYQLQSKDLSLVHSMIPLGSCTMKLNGTTQMELIGHDKSSNIHPHAPVSSYKGYQKLFSATSAQLAALTGMDATSLQPNSGAQGEFAGLRAIRKYHEQQPGPKRDICLIPVSAHGTNPASAAMAGMRVVPVKCDTITGNLDLADLEAKCKKHEEELGAFMVTYPSTFGVFEPGVKKACQIVHAHGGQVYMDGANMNAQIGLTSPGALGADVCHLNLHKTFCIPHGGGGPGIGPICVKSHLEPFLPHKDSQTPVSSAPFGSASIVPISWSYIATMGDKGLRKATSMALLNANYLLARLKDHYPILYTNDNGRCAHEFIIDARPFRETAGVEAIDIAKRLQDYGFHAPTMSWPVPNTLMIEPTESESKEELDRFADALISIRAEIREIEEGKQPRQGNVLRNSPHTQKDLLVGDGEGRWDRPYSREKAAYPLPYLMEKKFWPTVTRVDDTYGDTNLFCTCPPVEDTTQSQTSV